MKPQTFQINHFRIAFDSKRLPGEGCRAALAEEETRTRVTKTRWLERPGQRIARRPPASDTARGNQQWYNRPTQTGSIVRYIGEGWHANWLPAEQLLLLEIDADYWKTWVHQRLSTPMGTPGAMTLFRANPQEHLSLAKHLTAETKTEEFIAGKGVVTKWERIRKQNHWFDALYNACCAGHAMGVRLVDEVVAPPPPRPVTPPEQIAQNTPWGPNGWMREKWRDYVADARDKYRNW